MIEDAPPLQWRRPAPALEVLAWCLFGSPLRWLALFLAAVLCLPPLPIVLGGSGPHIALAFALAGLCAGLLRPNLWRRDAPPASVWLLVQWLTLFGSISFAAVYSGVAVAAGSMARVLLFGISIYVFFYVAAGPGVDLAIRPGRWVRALFAAGVFSALFGCIDFLFQLPAPAGFSPQFIWFGSQVYRRAQGFFYEASTLGNVCAFFLTMVMVCLSIPRDASPVPRRWLIPGAALLSAALLLSFSRASLVNLAAALATLAWLTRRRMALLRSLALLAVIALAAVAATWLLVPGVAQSYWLRLQATGSLLLDGQSRVLSGRVESWQALIGFLADHPGHAIFGIGYKTLPYSDFIGQAVVADNAYLSSLVETGCIGFAVFLLFHASILKMAFRAAHHHDRWARFFGTWMACFWVGEMAQMLSGDLLTYWRALPVYLWVLAMAVLCSRERALS